MKVMTFIRKKCSITFGGRVCNDIYYCFTFFVSLFLSGLVLYDMGHTYHPPLSRDGSPLGLAFCLSGALFPLGCLRKQHFQRQTCSARLRGKHLRVSIFAGKITSGVRMSPAVTPAFLPPPLHGHQRYVHAVSCFRNI